jgi:hypothetical protein
MEESSHQKQFDLIYADQMRWFTNHLTFLVDMNRIDDSDALFTEYVVDGEDPDDSVYFTCPRIKNYWDKHTFETVIKKILE